MSHPHDPSNLAQVIRDFPKQFAAGLELAAQTKLSARGIQRVLVAGMGGSALPADLLGTYLAPEIHVDVCRDYALEPKPDARTLVIISSFSGTTEEALSCLDEAVKLRVPLVAISHGGTLATRAAELGVPHVELPPVIQPRYATGLFFSSMVGLLEQVGAIIDRSRDVAALGEWLGGLDLEQTGEQMATQVGAERVPMVYGSPRFWSVARIWKIKINENAKTQAFWNVFPELNHNEMVGFTNLRLQPAFFLLQSRDDHPRTQKRMRAFRELMTGRKNLVIDVEVPPGTWVFQAFATLLLGDWVAYYLAVQAGVDPTPVDMVEDFKRRMVAGD